MKKLMALILAMTLIIVCFSGCGNKKENVDGKVTLHIGLPSGGDLTPLEILEEFKAQNPDIIVTTDEAPWSNFRSKLDMQLGGA